MSLFSKIFFCIVVVSISSMAATYVAVVETTSDANVLTRSEKNFVTDRLRERANKVLPEYLGYIIMTRENINAMLPPGKVLEDCEGECLVETGRNINANYIAQARVGKFGKKLTLTVELYETKNNKLVGSFTALESTPEGLLKVIGKEADSLFKHILQPVFDVNISSMSNASSSSAPVFANVENDSKHEEDSFSVKIGNQVWMKRNMDIQTPNSLCYAGKEENCATYGRLYTWEDAMKVCPAGWHLPSSDEWKVLFTVAGGAKNAGEALKSKSGWYDDGNGLNAFGFSALPAGSCGNKTDCDHVGYRTYFWSSTAVNAGSAYYWGFFYYGNAVNQYSDGKTYAFSVRCVKD